MKPLFVIIDGNTLSCMALKTMLVEIVPFADIQGFGTFDTFQTSIGNALVVHYFVTADVLISHASYFKAYKQKVIALVGNRNDSLTLSGFRSLDITQSEEVIVKTLLRIHESGHPHGHTYVQKYSVSESANIPSQEQSVVLTHREKEVLCRVVKGFINKEIAEQLHISITTVISHRQNICNKLGSKSIGRLTIYAVLNQIVNAGEL